MNLVPFYCLLTSLAAISAYSIDVCTATLVGIIYSTVFVDSFVK